MYAVFRIVFFRLRIKLGISLDLKNGDDKKMKAVSTVYKKNGIGNFRK